MTEQEHIILDGILRDDPFSGVYDGHVYFLGAESPERLDWQDAMNWCKSLGDGYELPSKEILIECWVNKSIRREFRPSWYWSSSVYGKYKNCFWNQSFNYGGQYTNNQAITLYVRSVRKIKI